MAQGYACRIFVKIWQCWFCVSIFQERSGASYPWDQLLLWQKGAGGLGKILSASLWGDPGVDKGDGAGP